RWLIAHPSGQGSLIHQRLGAHALAAAHTVGRDLSLLATKPGWQGVGIEQRTGGHAAITSERSLIAARALKRGERAGVGPLHRRLFRRSGRVAAIAIGAVPTVARRGRLIGGRIRRGIGLLRRVGGRTGRSGYRLTL